MAQPLREYRNDVHFTRKGKLLPMVPTAHEPARVSTGVDYNFEPTIARDPLETVKSYLDWVQRDAITSYEALKRRRGSLQRRTMQELKRNRQERPLQMLVTIMGIAFAIGFALRLRRSSHNE